MGTRVIPKANHVTCSILHDRNNPSPRGNKHKVGFECDNVAKYAPTPGRQSGTWTRNMANSPTGKALRLEDMLKDCIRPLSAPAKDVNKRKLRTRSAVGHDRRRKPGTPSDEGDGTEENEENMGRVVKEAKEVKRFHEETDESRKQDIALLPGHEPEDGKTATPVFNKRLFASQGAVIITQAARTIMERNGRANAAHECQTLLSKSEVQSLRCVTEGLKLIHKGHDFVKDVLSRVVTYEFYKAFDYVPNKHWEDGLSCYYILNGAVEVTYDMRSAQGRNVFQANIVYSHGTGEYLGLVSSEGPTEDLIPPATIYTKELTQFIRIDRKRFHRLMKRATNLIDKRKRAFVANRSFLSRISPEVKEKVIPKLTIHDYPANRVLLAQGEVTEYLSIIMTGRCQSYREVYVPEADKEVLFYLTSRDPDDFFGEECILDRSPSVCTIATATAVTIFKLHRSAFQMVNKDRLAKFIDQDRHEFPTDGELRDRGYKDSIWGRYKHTQIKHFLREGGKLRYLKRPQSAPVQERPPTAHEQYTENIYRFIQKGSQMKPVSIGSAGPGPRSGIRRRTPGQKRRPMTAFARSRIVEGSDDGKDAEEEKPRVPDKEPAENGEEEADGVTDLEDAPPRRVMNRRTSRTLMTAEKAREIEKQYAKRFRRRIPAKVMFKTRPFAGSLQKAMESDEALLHFLEQENAAFGKQFKEAWKAEDKQEQQQNFMKNGVLVTMTSEDIVRKAKAVADRNADNWDADTAEQHEQDWDTILHAENKQAKLLVTANKFKLKELRKRIKAVQEKREKLNLLRFAPPKEEQELGPLPD